ncbi:hypothetical protein BHE74_00057075 [Ensete ventricosum]|nr:hypothetical protein BHE74_00057075 [Ensete ventricosum]
MARHYASIVLPHSELAKVSFSSSFKLSLSSAAAFSVTPLLSVDGHMNPRQWLMLSDPEGVLSDGFEGDPVTGVYFGKVACRWEDGISGGSE